MISSYILPIIILITFIYSYKKINIYDEFIEGSSESFKIVLNIFPNLLAMFLAVNIFINSGLLDYIVKIFPFPHEEIMMILLRPMSGSTSLVLLDNIYSKYGPDSRIGVLSSIIQKTEVNLMFFVHDRPISCIMLVRVKSPEDKKVLRSYMKYLKQFTLILAISFLGEILHYLIPLPIPASIYGLVLLFAGLESRLIPLHAVKEISEFLIEIMPVMFIPVAVGLIDSWGLMADHIAAYLVVTFVTTVAVMAISGLVTQLVIRRSRKDGGEHE